jgi:SAM-dependent methyltransferase
MNLRLTALRDFLGRMFGKPRNFSSRQYWIERYALGGNSGAGSYERFAEHKARVLNDLVARHGIGSVIEFGCGDGNQLRYARYPAYLGLDISPLAIARCRELFAGDATKRFELLDMPDPEQADLALSLDVIYHLVEDRVFDDYMRRLFASARRFVAIYSSDSDAVSGPAAPHVRHRRFSAWIASNAPGWVLHERIPNEFPYDGNPLTSTFAEFHIYRAAAVPEG